MGFNDWKFKKQFLDFTKWNSRVGRIWNIGWILEEKEKWWDLTIGNWKNNFWISWNEIRDLSILSFRDNFLINLVNLENEQDPIRRNINEV